MITREETTNWYIEFGHEAGKEPLSFGPFRSSEAARDEAKRILSDEPNTFGAGGYNITNRPDVTSRAGDA
jgi:hypothetical protein